MSGYKRTPPKKKPDQASVIAALLQDKRRLQQEIAYWKHQARHQGESQN